MVWYQVCLSEVREVHRREVVEVGGGFRSRVHTSKNNHTVLFTYRTDCVATSF